MIVFLLGLGIAFSQFYVFKSGIPQPAHYLIALALSGIFIKRGNPYPSLKFSVAYISLLGFVLYQALVNLFYFVIYEDLGFIFQLTYISFGFLVFTLISKLSLSEKNFQYKISLFSLFGLILLFFLPIMGFGQYEFFPRYNAYFNDPNQMAFWVLCITAICICHYHNAGSLLIPAIIFIVAAYLILLTSSRSGFVGFSVLIFGLLASLLGRNGSKIQLRNVAPFLAAALIIIFGIYYISNNDPGSIEFLLDRIDSIDTSNQAEMRGFSRLKDHPEYILLGAGHGMEGRFSFSELEIHSTWAGVLFYYGLPGILLLLTSVFSIFKRLSFSEKLFFLAPLFYSFSTFGLRTPIFWVFLGFFYGVVLKKLPR
jgi:hypothetical protein